MNRTVVVFTGPYAVSVFTEPVPRLDPEQVLVRNRFSAISPGTELLIYRGLAPQDLAVDSTIASLPGTLSYPLRYGYAGVGKVFAVGEGLDPSWIGRWVFSFQPHQSLYVASPDELVPLPSDIDPENALFVPSMETAVNFLMDGRPVIGEKVVVFGQGVVGLLTTALLARMPLSALVTLDRHPLRRRKSLEAGAHVALSPDSPRASDDLGQALGSAEKPASADLAFELSGNPAALDQAVAACGFDARIVVGSWYGTRRVSLDLGRSFHRNRIRLISSQVSTLAPIFRGRWSKQRRMTTVWEMLRSVRPASLITHRVPVRQVQKAFELLDRDPENTVQAILTYEDAA